MAWVPRITACRTSRFTVEGDRATARSYVHALLQAIPDDSISWVEALGHYDDELVRTAEGWRIASARRTSRECSAGARILVLTEADPTGASPAGTGRWAVIAGASEGIGACLADQLAARGLDLVLIARNGSLLDESRPACATSHGVEMRPLVLDLTDSDIKRRVADATEDSRLAC